MLSMSLVFEHFCISLMYINLQKITFNHAIDDDAFKMIIFFLSSLNAISTWWLTEKDCSRLHQNASETFQVFHKIFLWKAP